MEYLFVYLLQIADVLGLVLYLSLTIFILSSIGLFIFAVLTKFKLDKFKDEDRLSSVEISHSDYLQKFTK